MNSDSFSQLIPRPNHTATTVPKAEHLTKVNIMSARDLYDFSPHIRAAIKSEELEPFQLRQSAGLSKATMNRIQNGNTAVSAAILKAWANDITLPHGFRAICANWVADMTDAVALPSVDLDADHDGRITMRDADMLTAQADLTSVMRRSARTEALNDGVLTEDEAANDERLCFRAMGYEKAVNTIVRRVAATNQAEARANWRR